MSHPDDKIQATHYADSVTLAHIARLEQKLAETEATLAEVQSILSDPVKVHVNMLRGIIAPITMEQCAHVHGEAAVVEYQRQQAALPYAVLHLELLREADEAIVSFLEDTDQTCPTLDNLHARIYAALAKNPGTWQTPVLDSEGEVIPGSNHAPEIWPLRWHCVDGHANDTMPRCSTCGTTDGYADPAPPPAVPIVHGVGLSREPTEAMMDAALNLARDGHLTILGGHGYEHARMIWQAMLDAAPAPPEAVAPEPDVFARIREIAAFASADNEVELMGRLETIWKLANDEVCVQTHHQRNDPCATRKSYCDRWPNHCHCGPEGCNNEHHVAPQV
jgi:hypothetical protein